MRILHITPAYYPATYWGGPIYSVYGLNNALAALSNVELQILTTDSAGPLLSQRLNIKKINLEELYPNQTMHFSRRIFRNSTSLEYLGKLPELIRWADVVHLTAVYSFTTLPALMICRLLGKPLVWSPRGALLELDMFKGATTMRLKRMWNFIANSIINFENMTLHVTSQEEKAASINYVPAATAVIIPNGVFVPKSFPVRAYLPNDHLRVIYMGRLDLIKGLENLLEAFTHIENQNISLTIFGIGDPEYTSKLQQLALDLKLPSEKVRFAGYVDHEAKTRAYLNADVCILPSYSENYGMAVAEALAYGVPVIASHGTPWQKVEERKCGLWVENTPQSLAEALRKLHHMDLAVMGRNGWQWMKEDFDWHNIAERMFEIYSYAINKKLKGIRGR